VSRLRLHLLLTGAGPVVVDVKPRHRLDPTAVP